jgi:hypothetical protein
VVPYNQPVAALDLLNRFLKNESFVDVPSPLVRFGDSTVAPALKMANPTNVILQEAVGGNGFAIDGSMSNSAVATFSFVAGILLTLLISKMWTTKQGTAGYSRIPDGFTTNGSKN